MLMLVNNAVQKMRKRVTNTISLYKLTNVLLLFICFKLVLNFNILKIFFENEINFINFIINLQQMNNKRTLVNLYEDIVQCIGDQCKYFLYDIVYQ